VVGEVVEINLLRTVLLETGNWADTGIPRAAGGIHQQFCVEGPFLQLLDQRSVALG